MKFAIIGTGIMVSVCLDAANVLKKKGINARVINMSTIKPIDEDILGEAAVETGAIVTAEEHNVEMGMGAAISMVIAERKHVPMKRVGKPEEIAEACVFLLSDRSSYVNATNLKVDGGQAESKMMHTPGRSWGGKTMSYQAN